MSFDENNFERLSFDPFGFDNVLLNNTNDPDENIFINLSQVDSVFTEGKQQQVLKKSMIKLFFVVHLSVRSLN